MRGNSEELNRELTAALDQATRPATARKGLAFLFPKAEEVLKTFIHVEPTDSSERRRGRRISLPDFGRTYFRMTPEKASWSRSEIDQIFSQDDPIAGMDMMAKRVISSAPEDRPRLRRLFLDELRAVFKGKVITPAWLFAIVEYSTDFIKAEDLTGVNWYIQDNLERLRFVVYDGLQTIGPERRAAIFLDVIPKVSDISLLCDVVSIIAGWIRKDPDYRSSLSQVTFGDNASGVREALVDRVREFAQTGKLWQQARPARILWFWWGSTVTDEVREFTSAELKSTDTLRSLLEVPIQLVRSTAGNYEHVGRVWSKIINIDHLAKAAQSWLDNSNFSDKDHEIARRYIAAYERRDDFPS